MKIMKAMGIVFLSLLLTGVFASAPVSADSSLKRFILLNNLLTNSNNYNIVWEGPYAGGTALITFKGGSSGSALSSLDLNSNNFDVLYYEKKDITSYSSNNPSYSGYSPNRYSYYSSPYRSYSYSGGRQYFSDNSERLLVDNTISNTVKQGVVYPFYDNRKGYYNWRYAG